MIVCSRDRPDLLRDALTAIRGTVRPGDEAIVVDSASEGDGTRRVAEEAGLRVVRCDLPGASRARNAGAAATSQPLLAFTDDDCRPEPGWLSAVEEGFSGDRTVGFVTGRVLADRDDGAHLSVIDDDTERRFEAGDDPITMGHGANLAVRRVAFEAVRGFDERLGAGAPFRACEDKDVFWRLLRAGWAGRYLPDAVVVHEQWRSRAETVATRFSYGIGDGAFAAKVARLDGGGGARLLGDRVWRQGVRLAARDLRAGFELGAAGDLASAAGVVVGAVRGALTPMDGDVYPG